MASKSVQDVQLLLQLQRQYGNRYVQYAVAMSRMDNREQESTQTQGHSMLVQRRPDPRQPARQQDPVAQLGRTLWQVFPSGVAVAFYDQNEPVAVRRARDWAKREQAIAAVQKPVTARNLALGRAFPDSFDLKTTLPQLGKALSTAAAKAGKPSGITPQPGTGPSRVRVLGIFSHGTSNWVGLGKGITVRQARSIVRSIAPVLSGDVRVILYACSAARGPSESSDWFKGTFKPGGKRSLAAKLRDALVEEGAKEAQVWGHTTMGHMTRNFALRVFYATHGKGTAGESYAGTLVLEHAEEFLAFIDIVDEIARRGYLIPAKKVDALIRVASRYLSRGLGSLFYRCYARANKRLKYRGRSLAEMAPLYPGQVAKLISAYWHDTFWPKHMPRTVNRVIARLRLKKAAASRGRARE